jgi:hypothetical protein
MHSLAHLGDQTIRALFDGLRVIDCGYFTGQLGQFNQTLRAGMTGEVVPKDPTDIIADVQDWRRRGANMEEIINDRLTVKVKQIS